LVGISAVGSGVVGEVGVGSSLVQAPSMATAPSETTKEMHSNSVNNFLSNLSSSARYFRTGGELCYMFHPLTVKRHLPTADSVILLSRRRRATSPDVKRGYVRVICKFNTQFGGLQYKILYDIIEITFAIDTKIRVKTVAKRL
jgi:hypothetical protein